MSSDGFGENLPGAQSQEIERVNDVLKPSAVKNVSEEPEAVATQRLKNEKTAYILIVCIAASILFVLLGFLMLVYLSSETTPDTKGRVVAGLIAVMGGAAGVLAGKKL